MKPRVNHRGQGLPEGDKSDPYSESPQEDRGGEAHPKPIPSELLEESRLLAASDLVSGVSYHSQAVLGRVAPRTDVLRPRGRLPQKWALIEVMVAGCTMRASSRGSGV